MGGTRPSKNLVAHALVVGMIAAALGVLAPLGVSLAHPQRAEAATAFPTPMAYVANLASSTVTPITVSNNARGSDIHVTGFPTDIAMSPDGTTAYVGSFVSQTTGFVGTVSLI